MNIGGFQKNTLIDFPETIACIIFTQGCNFCCPYCHNPDLVASTLTRSNSPFDENEIFTFLEARKGLLQGVVISGGEPTLQKDLIEFCKEVKSMGYKIKLDSNGTQPEILATLFDLSLIDFISMDIKTSLENYHLAAHGNIALDKAYRDNFNRDKIVKSIQLLMECAPLYEFRTTCIKPFVDKEIMHNIGKMVEGASKYTLQKCSRRVPVLDPQFLQSDTNFFSDRQMVELKNIIDQYVVSSLVR